MGRLTQMVTYLNSSTDDWNKPPVKIRNEDFTHFSINKEAKAFRKNFKYKS